LPIKKGLKFVVSQNYPLEENIQVVPVLNMNSNLESFAATCKSCSRLIWARKVSREAVEKTFALIHKVVSNILANPEDDKYKKIRCENMRVAELLTNVDGAYDLLIHLGFHIRINETEEKSTKVYQWESDSAYGSEKLEWFLSSTVQSQIRNFGSTFRPIKFKVKKTQREFVALFDETETVNDIYDCLSKLKTLKLPQTFAVFENVPRKLIEKQRECKNYFGSALFVMDDAITTVGGTAQAEYISSMEAHKKEMARRAKELKRDKEEKKRLEAEAKEITLRAFRDDRDWQKERATRKSQTTKGITDTSSYAHED